MEKKAKAKKINTKVTKLGQNKNGRMEPVTTTLRDVRSEILKSLSKLLEAVAVSAAMLADVAVEEAVVV